MKKNKALAVPFVLWAVLFIAVPLAMVVWYGVTVEETPAYVEVAGDNGQTLFQLEDGTVTAERPQKRTVVSLANFRRMLEPTYLKLLLRSIVQSRIDVGTIFGGAALYLTVSQLIAVDVLLDFL